MLLGQLVAISVASNLFYLALTLSAARPPSSDKASERSRAPPTLWASVLISLFTIAISPFTTERTFLPNLLVMHALLAVPLLSARPLKPAASSGRFTMRISTLYIVIQVCAFAMRLRTFTVALRHLNTQSPYDFVIAVWGTLHSHPAQSSIGWDVVWTTISFVVWVTTRPVEDSHSSKMLDLPYLLLATPLASVGVTAPHVLRPRDKTEHLKAE